MELCIEIQLTIQNSNMLGAYRVTVQERKIVRIFNFKILNFQSTDATFELYHNQTLYYTCPASMEKEPIYEHIDDISLGRRGLLDFMDKVFQEAAVSAQSELAAVGRRSGLLAIAIGELVVRSRKHSAATFEAICMELFALPESVSPWQTERPIVIQ